MKKFLLITILLLPTLVFFTGCNDNNPVSTGFTSASGYKINLGTTSKTVPYGARLNFTAIILDDNGNPVPTSPYPVTFSSSLGAEFAPMQTRIASGVVSAVYVAPRISVAGSIRAADMPEIPIVDSLPQSTALTSGLPKSDTITVSFLGASAKLKIFLYQP